VALANAASNGGAADHRADIDIPNFFDTCVFDLDQCAINWAEISLKKTQKTSGIVVANALTKMTVGVAALVTATWLGTASGQAYGNAPCCAVISLSGDVYWNRQYYSVEQCTPNVIAGNRGFCALNPWPGSAEVVPYRYLRRYSPY
jgi:hypothetical protein